MSVYYQSVCSAKRNSTDMGSSHWTLGKKTQDLFLSPADTCHFYSNIPFVQIEHKDREKKRTTHLYSPGWLWYPPNQSLISARVKIVRTSQSWGWFKDTARASAWEWVQTFVFLWKGNYIYISRRGGVMELGNKGKEKKKESGLMDNTLGLPLARDRASLKNSSRGDLWSLSKLMRALFYPLSQSCYWESDSHYRPTHD